MEACRAWRPDPPTAEHLDRMFMTPLGMLDIVIKHAAPYPDLRARGSRRHAGGVSYWVCDPRSVLTALEGRTRAKDRARAPACSALCRRFGMPDPPD